MVIEPTTPTIIFVSLFLFGYCIFLVRSTVRNAIDFYDFALLASVAFVPCAFAYFPSLTKYVSRMLGVEFPFVVLFGVLFFFAFLYLNRLAVKFNRQGHAVRRLTQELSLLREQLQSARRAATQTSVYGVDMAGGSPQNVEQQTNTQA